MWHRAWDLERTYWCNAHRSLEYVNKLCPSPMYLCWWQISDTNPNLIGMCENMARMVCKSSMLKCDDVRLKSLTNSWRWCELCDFSVEEDLWHCIMQCPAFQGTRIRMFNDVESIFARDGQMLPESGADILALLIGAVTPGISPKTMVEIWKVSGTYISEMYEARVKPRLGIG